MPDAAALRRLAAALPGAEDASQGDQLVFSVGGKGFAWTYMQRAAPRKGRIARPDVLAVRCPMERKEMLLEAAPQTFFDDDHYRGYPAVLVRLDVVDEAELAGLLADACALQAAKAKPRRRR